MRKDMAKALVERPRPVDSTEPRGRPFRDINQAVRDRSENP
jgi:hypothetical protein